MTSYKLLYVLEFSSAPKRMSIIVKNVENQLLLLCKGTNRFPLNTVLLACLLCKCGINLSFSYFFDYVSSSPSSVMFERLSRNERDFEATIRDHIKQYAEAGLRTLVVAYRELNEEEFRSWEKEFLKAQTSLNADRDAMVDAVADKIESNLILLGVTAVEDKLQKGSI